MSTTADPGGAAVPHHDRNEIAEISLLTGSAFVHDRESAAFVATAAPQLARTAWLLCGDSHQADELVQQALVRTCVAWPRARERDPLAYARRTLANLRIQTWRRPRRELLVDPVGLPDGDAAASARHTDRDQLVRALATLSVRQRRIVALRHLKASRNVRSPTTSASAAAP